jgi:hypothetical protein
VTIEPPVETPEATPSDVAALITARTKDRTGTELGDWSEETRPTTAQVQTRIDIARSKIRTEVGVIPDKCLEGSESAVALLAAMLCEAAFWPEQTVSNQSTYERLAALYAEAREGLDVCVAGVLSQSAYELDVGHALELQWPADWFQRDLDNRLAAADELGP